MWHQPMRRVPALCFVFYSFWVSLVKVFSKAQDCVVNGVIGLPTFVKDVKGFAGVNRRAATARVVVAAGQDWRQVAAKSHPIQQSIRNRCLGSICVKVALCA